jgi:hypothetical protein
MKGRRTGIDFSKHKLTVEKSTRCTIYDFKQPGTVIHRVIFINACNILSVTGDFGNWVFCREFHPKRGEKISDGYWMEKATIASCQEFKKYDSETTCKLIDEEIEEISQEGYYSDQEAKMEHIEFLNECKKRADEELEYLNYAVYQSPSWMDFESMIVGKKVNHWLYCIFDAFEAMCLMWPEVEFEFNQNGSYSINL